MVRTKNIPEDLQQPNTMTSPEVDDPAGIDVCDTDEPDELAALLSDIESENEDVDEADEPTECPSAVRALAVVETDSVQDTNSQDVLLLCNFKKQCRLVRRQRESLFRFSKDCSELQISCTKLSTKTATDFERAFCLYCCRAAPQRSINPMQMEEFADCIIMLLVRLGLNVLIDWEMVFCFLTYHEMTLLIYYWKMSLLKAKNQSREMPVVLQRLKDTSQGTSAPALTALLFRAIRAAATCDLCCRGFFNSFLMIIRCQIVYLTAKTTT